MTARPNHMGPANAAWLSPIREEEWRKQAECRRRDLHNPTLWDDWVDGDPREDREQRKWRQAIAVRICKTRCPVRQECAAAVVPRVDEGVMGGRIVPSRFGKSA